MGRPVVLKSTLVWWATVHSWAAGVANGSVTQAVVAVDP